MLVRALGLEKTVLIIFLQAEDGIRELVRSRGLGDVYKRQALRHGKQETGQQAAIPKPAAARHVCQYARLKGKAKGQGLSLIPI